MNRTRIIAVVVALVVAVAAFAAYRKAKGHEAPEYRFATLVRGDMEAAVSATGALGAVTTVQVGTQVSGKVVAIHADFNDHVTKGQLVARIDPVLAEQTVRDAQAQLERNQAQLDQAKLEYGRNERLFKSKVLTEIDFNTAKYNYSAALANVKSARVTLDRARQNLAYTSIYAPIDGIVVERDVDVGQTVAASLSAPQLFLIAQDLSQMQILSPVDESDIGSIQVGQPVRFTVLAYPNERFAGKVKQVRLQSKTQDNVVNYTVVVAVENPNGKLLPGMTATLEFLTGSATNVLLVPNAALRFRATDEMMAEVRKRFQSSSHGERSGGAQAANATGGPGFFEAGANAGAGAGNGARRPRNASMLWYLAGSGELSVVRVRTGLTDGQRTEVSGPGLKDGMQIIVGVQTAQNAAPGSNPFLPQQRPGGGRPGP
jgi:HlyD family secretion protein